MFSPKIDHVFTVIGDDWYLWHVVSFRCEGGYSCWSQQQDHSEYIGEIRREGGSWYVTNYERQRFDKPFRKRKQALTALISYLHSCEWPSYNSDGQQPAA